ncbi:hypothetical protein BAUCODRAFT_38484 [Baudoinia panamericana UAMH 10762]|uniref:Uncharacterized protein n=1 Tax=Baudoinia panamericana (strain UAMH 10762) TaxID=717646 RepID=M2LEK1_BAUPA|nr:uncharacterized protein BAUCODRAFT_38484 [Baudoinia panamericana UAMH 10762]EMC92422.1 hypothetical protein BAUCODRAFT_38484 [Baudoinia panamericana UAMH 10762]
MPQFLNVPGPSQEPLHHKIRQLSIRLSRWGSLVRGMLGEELLGALEPAHHLAKTIHQSKVVEYLEISRPASKYFARTVMALSLR